MDTKARRVSLSRIGDDLRAAVRRSLEGAGILDRVKAGTRVALKPNFTYPYYKRGVTTSPQVIREVVLALRERTDRIAVVETDGGYGAWQATEAFKGHHLYEMERELGIEVVNLCDEPREPLRYRSGGAELELPLPTRLLRETDVFITMPVPKIHCMTGLTLSYKNQWGVVPDTMRLRRHYVFDDAIVAINRALRPAVLADGTFFLDRNGPMEGDPVPMGLILGATDPGAFDRYVSQLMGWSWRDVPHLRRAASLGDLPADLRELSFDVHPDEARTRTFRLERTPRNWIALAGFKSRFITWFGYESWFGRGPLHTLLYAIAGKPVKPKPDEPSDEVRA
jgi:uncharacterized protein (DUF362 family)